MRTMKNNEEVMKEVDAYDMRRLPAGCLKTMILWAMVGVEPQSEANSCA
jgi:hypothetical protein